MNKKEAFAPITRRPRLSKTTYKTSRRSTIHRIVPEGALLPTLIVHRLGAYVGGEW